jgi:glycosyltransferase involved in cell wall biosynthesis
VVPLPWPEVLRRRLRGMKIPRQYVREDGIEVAHPTYYYVPKALRHHYGVFYYQSCKSLALAVVRCFRPDVIISSWAHPDGWAAVRLGQTTGLPVVAKVNGSDVLINENDKRRKIRIAEGLCAADAVVAVSEDLGRHVCHLGASPQRVHVVPEGIDDTLFVPGCQSTARRRLGIAADERMILFVGNLLKSKGIGILVAACQHLRQRNVEFHCYIVGGGRDEAGLRQAIKVAHLEQRVSLVGPLPHEQLPKWFRASDVVTLPSFSEVIPTVLREAIAGGRPFVATNVGGIPEIAHSDYSLLVPPQDSQALADGLQSALFRSPELAAGTLRASCNISWAESARRVSEILEEAVDKRRRPSAQAPAAAL